MSNNNKPGKQRKVRPGAPKRSSDGTPPNVIQPGDNPRGRRIPWVPPAKIKRIL